MNKFSADDLKNKMFSNEMYVQLHSLLQAHPYAQGVSQASQQDGVTLISQNVNDLSVIVQLYSYSRLFGFATFTGSCEKFVLEGWLYLHQQFDGGVTTPVRKKNAQLAVSAETTEFPIFKNITYPKILTTLFG